MIPLNRLQRSSATGFATIRLGVLQQRREAQWSVKLRLHLPALLLELIEVWQATNQDPIWAL
jgi:hypothetical protein